MQESNQLLLAVSSSFYWKAQNNLQQIQKAKESGVIQQKHTGPITLSSLNRNKHLIAKSSEK